MPVQSIDFHTLIKSPYDVVDSLLNTEPNFKSARDKLHAFVDDHFDLVPVLSPASLPEFSVVRFRGMVQDMFDTEMYSPSYSFMSNRDSSTVVHRQWTHFREPFFSVQGTESEGALRTYDNSYAERIPFLLIPVPGETAWVKKALNGHALDYHGIGSQAALGKDGVVVWMYSESKSPITLNEILEVAGIFYPAAKTTDWEASTDLPDSNVARTLLHSGSVSCLHALSARVLPVANPMLPRTLSNDIVDNKDAVKAHIGDTDIVSVRKEVLSHLQRACDGDDLLAELILLHLMSTRNINSTTTSNHGVLALNIGLDHEMSDISASSFVHRLRHVFNSLLPLQSILSVNPTSLITGGNSSAFMPVWEADRGKLKWGELQLPHGTHLLLDETAMRETKMEGVAVLNVRALITLLSHQTLEYDFQFYKKEFPTNVRVCIVSKGKSVLTTSALPYDVLYVPHKATNNSSDMEEKLENLQVSDADDGASNGECEKLRVAMRRYLSVVPLLAAHYTFPDDMQQRIMQYFVEKRQQKETWISSEELSLMLLLLKLHTLSMGQWTPSVDGWEKVCHLYSAVKARINKF